MQIDFLAIVNQLASRFSALRRTGAASGQIRASVNDFRRGEILSGHAVEPHAQLTGCSQHQPNEGRRRLHGSALEFRVVLHAKVERMLAARQFDYFLTLTSLILADEDQAGFFEISNQLGVNFVAVTMTLIDTVEV